MMFAISLTGSATMSALVSQRGMLHPRWGFGIFVVHQVDVVVDFSPRTMQGHNGVVRYPAFLVERLVGDVVATGEVVAVRDKHRSVRRHDEETGSACK